MESRFALETRAHYKLCSLIPEVIRDNKDLHETVDVLLSKWKHLMPCEDDFQSELSRWKQHCAEISRDKSVTSLLSENADPIFFPNVFASLAVQKLSDHFHV